MRVSIPICICSGLAVMALSWWLGTRSRNFLEAPSDAKLQEIRLRVEQSTPSVDQSHNAVGTPDDRDHELTRSTPVPVIMPSDLKIAPKLDAYSNDSQHGAAYLIELAGLLESGKHPQRALLCWERVIDSTKSKDSEIATAGKAIMRLRQSIPEWNSKHADAIPIVIHAGTGPTTAAQIRPVLEELARNLELASAGIVSARSNVTAGTEDLTDGGAAPVALWISGPMADSPSSDIVSISIESPDSIPQLLSQAVYRITRHHLARHSKLNPPQALTEQDSPILALQSQITRLSWQQFAKSLNSSLPAP